MEVRWWKVVSIAVALSAPSYGCALDTGGLRSRFDEPPEAPATDAVDRDEGARDDGAIDSGFPEADASPPPPDSGADAPDADDAGFDAAEPDASDSGASTPGSIECGDAACNTDPTKGSVTACCVKGSSSTCANTCVGGIIIGCDDHADCVALGRPLHKCCRRPSTTLCTETCLDGTELP
jgi:hypothetical protein